MDDVRVCNYTQEAFIIAGMPLYCRVLVVSGPLVLSNNLWKKYFFFIFYGVCFRSIVHKGGLGDPQGSGKNSLGVCDVYFFEMTTYCHKRYNSYNFILFFYNGFYE